MVLRSNRDFVNTLKDRIHAEHGAAPISLALHKTQATVDAPKKATA
jgi:hypothetical protein